jgi:hypothetical protein
MERRHRTEVVKGQGKMKTEKIGNEGEGRKTSVGIGSS